MLARSIALCFATLVVGCATTMPDYDYSKEPDPRRGEYVIGVADQLAINVWRNEEISSEPSVRPDGTITMPLLGDIRAAGKTPSQLREEIKVRLKRWIRDETAVVTVAVTKVNAYRFTVSGEVEKTGVFNTSHYITVVDAVALAGGFSRYAEREKVMILRRVGGALRQIPINFKLLAAGQHPEMNLVLMPEDVIIVP